MSSDREFPSQAPFKFVVGTSQFHGPNYQGSRCSNINLNEKEAETGGDKGEPSRSNKSADKAGNNKNPLQYETHLLL